MRTHSIELPFEVAPELIYEKKSFLIIDSQVTGINEMAHGDIIAINFLEKLSIGNTETSRIRNGDMMMVVVQYIEVISETILVVSIKPKSYSAMSFSVEY